ncbi:hypothetical protein RHMOL_Rhmol05G0257100 [Rhododendron molle]|uniref:Uncharacterized protein n=1 Tax=Rhododendron molle TaxID=49168 RepID=A0ACC0NT08_RHOML|nr:hypothetical protein RHMOL_Rhmol05G0257100 [Rhododendron molle]
MSTMSLLRAAAKSHRLIRTSSQNQGLPLLLRDSPMRFSTEAADHQPSSRDNSSVDPFLRPPTKGFVYGKLVGTTKHTTKSDILNFLEDCGLSLDDLRVDYSHYPRVYMPTGMMIQFPSQNAYDAAIKANNRKGRLYRLDRADRSQWDDITPYDGKAVLLQGIPRNAVPDDVERFLSGCVYDASTMEIFVRPSPYLIRMATVHFPSKTQAMHAFITKNRGFCLNSQILVRVLH